MTTTQPMTEAEGMRNTTRRVFEEIVNGRNSTYSHSCSPRTSHAPRGLMTSRDSTKSVR